MLPLHYIFFLRLSIFCLPAVFGVLWFLFACCLCFALSCVSVPVCSCFCRCACVSILNNVYPGGLSFWGFRSLSEQLNSNVVQTREHLKCYPIGYRPRYAPQGCFFMSLCAHDSSPASSGDFSPTASALWFIQNQQTTFGIYSALLPPNRQHIELGRAFSSSLAGKVDL